MNISLSGARITHITTLEDDTPKARRRVRRLLGLQKHHKPRLVDVRKAQEIATFRERCEAQRIAKGRVQKNPSVVH